MTNQNKQTAVEWQYIELSKFLNGKSEFTHKSDILIKAKEMENAKAFEIFKAGQDSMEEGGKGFEQFYNETYGDNK